MRKGTALADSPFYSKRRSYRKLCVVVCFSRSRSRRVYFRCFYNTGYNRYERAVFAALAELHRTVDHSEQGVVFADAYVLAGVVLSATLTNDDVAGDDALTTENFHAETLGMRFTTVVGATYAFLVCHGILTFTLLAVRY
jgi:hypothetical protein